MNIEIERKSQKIIEGYNDCSEIIKISSDNLCYNKFFYEFMLKNIPVIIKNVNLLTPVSKHWFTENTFDIKKFQKDIKEESEVPVYNCSKKYFNSHEKMTMNIKDYANYWRSENKNELLYLKDFHLKQRLPQLDFYNVPEYFASDWLNEYLIDSKNDDYRFVYIGVQGTWTPLHADVFNSYSWSGNVCGKKRWIMVPPKEELKLKDNLGQLPFSIDEEMLTEKNVTYFDIIQEPNDIIFVPSQWYHQVTNLTDVFSINHNWFNSCNIHIIKESLLKNYEDVKAEIQDCRDMENFENHCQVMLKSLFGIDFRDFIYILIHIGTKRSNMLNTNEIFKLFDKFNIGRNLVEHDKMVIRQVLEELLNVDSIVEHLKLKIQDYLSSEDLIT